MVKSPSSVQDPLNSTEAQDHILKELRAAKAMAEADPQLGELLKWLEAAIAECQSQVAELPTDIEQNDGEQVIGYNPDVMQQAEHILQIAGYDAALKLNQSLRQHSDLDPQQRLFANAIAYALQKRQGSIEE